MERLDKLVSHHGNLSRSDARKAVWRGEVSVNGVVEKKIDAKVSESDEVSLKGTVLDTAKFCYLMLNKPLGVVCATKDNLHKTVLELVPPELFRTGLFPAGRLDIDTGGFVLITDDGALAHRILAPKTHVPKKYIAVLDRQPPETAVAAFEAGIELDSGELTLPAGLHVLDDGEQPQVEVILHEGMFHQVKRMFASQGCKVLQLRRVQIGGLALDSALAAGEMRRLTPDEVALLECRE